MPLICTLRLWTSPSRKAWDESYNVTNAQLNRQHQTLFQMINDRIENPADEAKWGALVQYVVDHFATETEMLGAGMDAEHQKQHGDFVTLALTIKPPISEDVAGTLKKWLGHHIKNCDIPNYADFVPVDQTIAGKPEA